ncbi:MAG TPA: TatD family hydrolase [Reyranella sp.]|nr:TatD family hydrolase [Reyranella sp.]
MLEQYFPRDRGAVVLHWFAGSKSEARRAATLGCYFSVNAEMTRSARGRTLVAHLPMDRILTETDRPFTRIDGRPTESVDVRAATVAAAHARNLSVDSVDSGVRTNFRFQLRSDRGPLPPRVA